MKKRMTKRAWPVALLCIGATLGASVASVASVAQTAPPTVRASEVGHSTHEWLDLQSSNAQTAPARPMLGTEAGLAYRRYMASFNSKIPDLYGSALGSTGSTGSSGAGSGSSGSGASGLPGGTGSGGY